ncbi:MAG: peptidylprolyl isomerase [Thermodesulfobacteriota bacterium]|nr:peptidylprolyl isomerase [Thermodesulfobacteriota bacterium]
MDWYKPMLDSGYWAPGRRRLALLRGGMILGAVLAAVCFLDVIGLVASEEVIVATVNEAPITKAELDRVLYEYQRRTRQKNLTDQEVDGVLKSLIRRHLILQQPSVQSLRENETVVEQVREYEKGLVIGRFLKEEVGSKMTVTEDELRAYYDKNRHQYASPPKVEARHVLLRTRQDAEMVKEKLDKGEDFGKLAKEYSIDLPKALEGGSMGTIEKGKSLPSLEKVLFSLSVGDTSDIVETEFGFHILTVDKVIPASFQGFAEVKDGIRKTILRQKEVAAFDKMAATLEKDASIKIFEDKLR